MQVWERVAFYVECERVFVCVCVCERERVAVQISMYCM